MSSTDFAKLVPGFDFLQGLMKNAGSATGLPNMGQWIAPTLDPAEIEKRISELRTVQFWLEQNTKMLGATIQALEVQRMTLATLRTMNLPAQQLHDSMKLDAVDPPAAGPASAAEKFAGPVDPMQWWGALTRQFTELAANAIKEMPSEPPPAAAAPRAPVSAAAAAPAAAPAARKARGRQR